jgi:hypothetical protein
MGGQHELVQHGIQAKRVFQVSEFALHDGHMRRLLTKIQCDEEDLNCQRVHTLIAEAALTALPHRQRRPAHKGAASKVLQLVLLYAHGIDASHRPPA